MHSRRTVLALLVLAAGSATLSGPAAAVEAAPFTMDAFEKAKSAGKSILVEVHAPWCPTCKAQQPILAELLANPKFAGLMIFRVDFDSQKDALRALGARQQSTLIVYKGGKETGRSVGDTGKATIAGLLGKAV
jgi:thiol-disulfide isomerase/thioredoxin